MPSCVKLPSPPEEGQDVRRGQIFQQAEQFLAGRVAVTAAMSDRAEVLLIGSHLLMHSSWV